MTHVAQISTLMLTYLLLIVYQGCSDPTRSHSQQILALSYAWDKVLQRKTCDNIPIERTQKEMQQSINRNVKRLFIIALRAN